MPLTTHAHTHRNDSSAVWVRHPVWHAQANSKGIVLTSRGRSRPTILVPGVKEDQVRDRMEALTGQFQFKRLPSEPPAHKIVGEVGPLPLFLVRAEVAEMIWNDKVLMDLVFGDGAYVRALGQAGCVRELDILGLVETLIR